MDSILSMAPFKKIKLYLFVIIFLINSHLLMLKYINNKARDASRRSPFLMSSYKIDGIMSFL